MAYSYEQCWRKVLLYAPTVPVFLAREFVQQAFARVCEVRPWVWLRKEAHLQTLASRTLTVTFTTGSLAITSAALFVASDAGRQIKVDSIPIYTIDTVTDASNAILLETYLGTSGAQTATILDAYLYAPADLGRFLTIADPSNQRTIPFWFTEEVLNWTDPHRTQSGDPARALIAKGLSTRTATLGRLLYEWWPQPSAARVYPALYLKRPQTLTDTDLLQGVLAERGDVLVTGALMECARWPGTTERPNAYFNLQTYRTLREEFEQARLQLSLRDDDQAAMDLPQVSWTQVQQWPATDTNLLRASDATLAAYY